MGRTFQKRRVVPRENWMPYKVTEAIRSGRKLKVTVAADDPDLFQRYEAMKIAKRTARQNGFMKFESAGEVQVFGQNAMALREYIFTK